MEQLEGKVAVITGAGERHRRRRRPGVCRGGHVRGRGRRRLHRAAAVAAALKADGCQAAPFTVDVSDADAVVALATEVFARFGGCHLLHNNAGLCPLGRGWEHTAQEWRYVIGVNLLGVVHGVSAFVPRLLEQGEDAHIVNTASAAALRYVPSSTLYNTTKFGVVGLTENLREELAPHRDRSQRPVPRRRRHQHRRHNPRRRRTPTL